MAESGKVIIEQNVLYFYLYILYINFDTRFYSKIWFKFDLKLLTRV
jgi:hypothetical protein